MPCVGKRTPLPTLILHRGEDRHLFPARRAPCRSGSGQAILVVTHPHNTVTPRTWKAEYFGAALLLIGVAVIVYLSVRVFLPFLAPTFWATVLAILLHRVYEPATRILRSRSLAALVVCLLAVVILVLPSLYLVLSLRSQSVEAFTRLEATVRDPTGPSADPRLLQAWNWVVEKAAAGGYDLPSALTDFLRRSAPKAVASTPRLLGEALEFLFDLVLAFLTLFFFLRDGHRLVHWLRQLVPLGLDQTSELFSRIRDMIHATVFGGFAVALAQGALGGILFWVLGIPVPLLWGLIMGLLSLLPPLGAWLIWIPAGIVLLLQGHIVKAVILLAGGAFAVSLVDNILRPIIIGERTQLPTLLIFFSLAGGIHVFGAPGLIAGPIVVALLIAILEFVRDRIRAG